MPQRIPLLLVPGLLCDEALWRPQIEGLADIATPVVADVGQGEVFEVAFGPRRVGLDGVRGQAEVARATVGALAQVDPAFEGDAVDDDATVGERPVAGDEPR